MIGSTWRHQLDHPGAHLLNMDEFAFMLEGAQERVVARKGDRVVRGRSANFMRRITVILTTGPGPTYTKLPLHFIVKGEPNPARKDSNTKVEQYKGQREVPMTLMLSLLITKNTTKRATENATKRATKRATVYCGPRCPSQLKKLQRKNGKKPKRAMRGN